MRLVIDLDVLLANLRLGVTLLTERRREREAGSDHVLCDYRVAGLYREDVAELRRFGSGGLKTGQLDRRELVLLPGIGRQHHLERVGGPLRAGVDHRIIITLAPKQLDEEVRVRARPPGDLSGIGRMFSFRFEGRLLPEGREETF